MVRVRVRCGVTKVARKRYTFCVNDIKFCFLCILSISFCAFMSQSLSYNSSKGEHNTQRSGSQNKSLATAIADSNAQRIVVTLNTQNNTGA